VQILSEWDKKYVKELADNLLEDKKDWKKRENLEELWAAIYIIEKILGSEWYRRSVREIREGKQNEEDVDNFQTPISFYLGKKTAEFYMRIVQFASFLTILIDKSNVEEKIRDYSRREKRAEVTRNIFDGLFFELKTATYFADKDFIVEFVKEKPNVRTPDLKVSSPLNNSLAIECKRKRTEGFELNKILDSVYEASQQLEESHNEGIVAVEFLHTNDTRLDFEQIQEQIKSEFQRNSKLLGVWLIGEMSYTDNEKTHLVSKTKIFLNPETENEIFTEFKEVLLKPKAPIQKSLLEN